MRWMIEAGLFASLIEHGVPRDLHIHSDDAGQFGLCALADTLLFLNDEKLSHLEVADLLQETVIVPKIGSRIGLKTPKKEQVRNTYF